MLTNKTGMYLHYKSYSAVTEFGSIFAIKLLKGSIRPLFFYC